MANLFAKKTLEMIQEETAEHGEHTLRRVLGPINLMTLGIGAIIGAGIFVLTGSAAANYAGPAIVLSFVLAAMACTFAGLCYAEFASLIPIAGSAYTYAYATLGELFAWIIGWDLILEYALGAATVASGWSGYVLSFLQDFGIRIPPKFASARGEVLVNYHGNWEHLARIKASLVSQHIDPDSLAHTGAYFDLVAFLAIIAITAVLVIGIKESANLNTAIVFVKVSIVFVFIGVVGYHALRHPSIFWTNWHPFIPPNQGTYGAFGWSGIARGAAVIFFAYIGFDAVSTAAQEAKNPKRDMPIGILGSLIICTILYILVSLLLTGIVPYTALNVADPVAIGIDAVPGVRWGSFMVKIGAIFGLGTVMLVMLLGQSRVFYSMSRDGLLPRWAGAIHPRFRTPWISTSLVGCFVAVFAALLPIDILAELVSIGTLLAFVIVCAGVWMLRIKRPDLPRPFKTPLVPLVPILGIIVSSGLMASLPESTWLRLLIWLAVGLVLYFTYGKKHSRVQVAAEADSVAVRPGVVNP